MIQCHDGPHHRTSSVVSAALPLNMLCGSHSRICIALWSLFTSCTLELCLVHRLQATAAQLTAEHRATIRETVISQLAPLRNFTKAHSFPGIPLEPYSPASSQSDRRSLDFRRSVDYRRRAPHPRSSPPLTPLPPNPNHQLPRPPAAVLGLLLLRLPWLRSMAQQTFANLSTPESSKVPAQQAGHSLLQRLPSLL